MIDNNRAPTNHCPRCGGPVRRIGQAEALFAEASIAVQNGLIEEDETLVPALTGAQVDAAYRMVAAVRAWRGRMSPAGVTLHADQSDLLQAARDFEVIQQERDRKPSLELRLIGGGALHRTRPADHPDDL